MRRRSIRFAKRSGVQLVEAALVMSICLLFIIGILEYGRLMMTKQILDNAAREGARRASTGQKTNSQVSQAVLQYLTDTGLGTAGATVTVTNVTSGLDAASANQLDHLKVSVTLPYNDVRWTSLSLITSSTTTLSASADWSSMRDLPFTISQTIPTTIQ